MTTSDRRPFGDAPEGPEVPEAPEADVAEQRTPVDDSDPGSWPDAQRVSDDRDWQANEADLIEQSIEVPDDPGYETGFDR